MKVLKLFSLLIALLVTSCGFLSDEPVENQDLYNTREALGPSCELDPERIARIFDENIEDQIKCLRENFVQFSRFVITQNPDIISENDLTKFIQKFFASNSHSIIRGLHLLFELNMVMLRDHASSLSRDNVDALTNLLINTNKEGVIITKILRDMINAENREEIYLTKRRELRTSLRKLSQQTIEIIGRTDRNPQSLDIRQFMRDLDSNFDVGGRFVADELIESMLFLKKVLLGGESNQIDSDEVVELVRLVPDLFTEVFDLAFVDTTFFQDGDIGYQRFLQQRIKTLNDLFYPLDNQEQLFTEDDLFKIYDAFATEGAVDRLGRFDLYRLRPVLRGLKTNILGGSETVYTFGNLRSLLLFLNMGIEANLFYDQFKAITDNLKAQDPEEILRRRALFKDLFAQLHSAFNERQSEINALPVSMKVFEFVKIARDHFEDFNLSDEMIDVGISLKAHFLGGDSSTLTKAEFQSLGQRLPELANLFYDFNYLLPVSDKTEMKPFQVIEENIQRLQDLPLQTRQEGVVLTRNQIQTLLDQFISDRNQRHRFLNLIDSFQANILRSTLAVFDVQDLNRSLSFAQVLARVMEFLPDHTDLLDELKEDHPETFLERKERYLDHLKSFLRRTHTLLSTDGLIDRPVFYQDFIYDLALVFDGLSLDLELIEDLAPFKKLLLGGDVDRLSQPEVLALLASVEDLAPIVIDFLYGPPADDLFLVEFVRKLKANIYDLSSDDPILEIQDILKVAQRFIDLPLENFAPTVEILKQKIIGGDPDLFRGRDIGVLFSILAEVTELNYFNEVTYEAMSNRLDTIRTPLTIVPRYNLPQYRNLTASKIAYYQDQFEDIVVKHRYFRDPENGMQNWGHRIIRNKSGFKELALLKYGITYIIRGWGSPQPSAYKGYALAISELEQLLVDARPVLEELGLWTREFSTFARNTLLMGDLFQNISNGDQRLDIDEFSEYGTLVLTAIEIGDRFLNRLKETCEPVEGDDVSTWTFSPTCYRPHFFPILLNEFALADYMPMLDQYVRTDSPQDVANFVKNVEGFARDPDTNDLVPMRRREFILLIGAILNIEVTFLRFDTNQDNIVDANELERAFQVYERAIIMVANLEESREKYAKSIFLYMIKNMAIPSTAQLLNFHYNPFVSKEVEAKRLNIGTLLYYMVNN